MKRFLIAAGLHGEEEALHSFCRAVEECEPDGVLFAGGVLGPKRQYGIWNGTEWGMTRPDVLFLERFFRTLGDLNCFSAIIPGPFDTPLDEFLRLGLSAEIAFPHLHVVHGTLVTTRDMAVCGVGGRLVELPIPERDYIPRTTVEYYLRSLWNAIQPHKVLLLPAPPEDRLGGSEGNSVSNYLIDSYHPTLCVVGGGSACRGVERIASTLVVNPGCLADGWAAWLDWGHYKEENPVELLRLDKVHEKVGS